MKQKTNRELVPKLSFPEFRNAGEWDNKKFGEICKFVRGPFGGALTKDIFVKNGYAVYEQSHAINQNFDSFRYFITKEKYDELKRFSVKSNDIIMSCSGTMGKFAVIPTEPKEGVINQALLKLTVNKEYDLDFVKFTLELPINQEKLLSQSAGGAIKNVVGVSELKEIELPAPSFKEQQKIASCLSSLDDLIAAQAQKLDALKTHKKGLMQQLFPREGETLPRLRFPEFREAGDWEEKLLGNVCSTISSGKDKIDSNGDFDLYGSTGVIGKTSSGSYDGNFILVARVGANAGLLTRANGKFGVTDNTLVIVLKKSEKIDFIHYSLDRLGLNKMVFGSGQPLITGGQLKSLVVNFPSPEEQQKIAACLSSLDDLIVAQTKKIDALKTHKKGLMQQLFPSP